TLARRDRKARHLAAAEHLSATLGQDEIPEVIASHLVSAYESAPDAADAASLKERAAKTFALAGDRAASLAASGEAQRYFERAASLTVDTGAQAVWIDHAGQMAYSAGRMEQSVDLFGRARSSYEEQGNVVAAALVDGRLAEIDFVHGHPPVAAARLA